MPENNLFKAYDPDLYPDRAVGVLLPFNGNATLVDIKDGYNEPIKRDVKPFTLSYSTEEQAITNLVNLLLTRPGERPMQPRFGSPVPDYLFENNTPERLQFLQEGVEETIEFWLPYIILDNVSVQSKLDNSILESDKDHNVIIKIECKVTEAGANRTVTIFISDKTTNVEVI